MAYGPPPPLTEDDLLDVLRRNLDHEWILGLLEDPSSRALFVGMVAAELRVAAASDENLDRGGYIFTAPGRHPAVSTVRLSRPSGAAVVLSTLTRFVDERGMVWRPRTNYTIAASLGPQTVDVPIETVRAGYFLNSFGPLEYIAIDDLPDAELEVLAGDDPATEGTGDYLALHGAERAVPRAPLESDDDYRHRMTVLEDKVSPTALAETALTILDAYPATKVVADQIVRDGLRVLREPFADSGQPGQRGLQGSRVAFFDDVFFDDPHGPSIRDRVDFSAWFDVLLPTLIAPDEDRLFYDDGFFDDPLMGLFDTPTPASITLPIAALVDELDRRRAGGVRFAVYMGLDLSLDRHPPTLAQAGDWTAGGADAPATLVDAVARHRADADYAVSTVGRGAAAALDPGDLLFSFPTLSRAPAVVRYVRLVAQVRRGTTGGIAPVLAFLVRPTTAGAAERTLALGAFPTTIDFSDWRELDLVLEENPITGLPWTLADVAGTLWAGVANVAAVVTDELRVAELRLEVVANFG